MKRLVLLLALGATGCASAPPPEPIVKTVIQTVNVPTPVRCRPAFGPDPAYPDADKALTAATDVFDGVRLLMAGRALRMAREGELKAALSGCAG